MNTMHPSRVSALKTAALPEPSADQPPQRFRGKPTKQDKLALAEQKRLEIEKAQKERERKIKIREKRRKALRKMTPRGQPVMKTRLEDLLGKVKKVMRDV
jgi:rRNA processing